MRFQAEVLVTLRRGVLDAQGETVAGALKGLGYHGVSAVRVGKHLQLELDAESEDQARRQVDEMCRRLLANPVLEDYRVELKPRPGAGGSEAERRG